MNKVYQFKLIARNGEIYYSPHIFETNADMKEYIKECGKIFKERGYEVIVYLRYTKYFKTYELDGQKTEAL